jgi:GTP-binding protein
MNPEFSEAEIAAGRTLFLGPVTFVTSVAALDTLPAGDRPEIALAGRSNVGKSSLVNALTRRNTLAKTSNTPGRTQMLNYFDLGGRAHLVDMPGYGYAEAPKTKVAAWNKLVLDYLKGRPNLVRVLVLIDARHGPKPPDREIMAILDKAAVSYQLILTKMDKPSAKEASESVAATVAEARKHPAAHPDVIATSAVKDEGIDALRAALAGLPGIAPK